MEIEKLTLGEPPEKLLIIKGELDRQDLLRVPPWWSRPHSRHPGATVQPSRRGGRKIALSRLLTSRPDPRQPRTSLQIDQRLPEAPGTRSGNQPNVRRSDRTATMPQPVADLAVGQDDPPCAMTNSSNVRCKSPGSSA